MESSCLSLLQNSTFQFLKDLSKFNMIQNLEENGRRRTTKKINTISSIFKVHKQCFWRALISKKKKKRIN